MASDEVLFKVALDLSKADNQFKDHSQLWEKHQQDIAKGEKVMQSYADNTVKDYEKINKAVKSRIGQVASEGKAIQELDKKFQNLSKKNNDAFNTKELKEFDTLIQQLSKNMGAIENLNLSVDDIDTLISKLSNVEDDFETLNVLVGFFEDKMKQASVGVGGSLDDIKEKIRETQLNIKSTEDFIKDIGKQISNTAPGAAQASLISEREAAKKALNEETVALEDYKQQLKSVRSENTLLSTELQKVKDELVKLEIEGERGSARWIELREKAVQYNEALKDTNAELKLASSNTAGIDNLIGAVNGVVGVFAAAEGAQALFGDQSEDLQKTLVKLNGALALLNGLQAIQAELALKGSISNRALVAVQKLYSVATDASAKSTLRLGAALKLLGIGLIIGGIAALVVYWKDIAKFIGITSDESERLNEVNKTSNDLYGEQIAKLKILVNQVKQGELSFKEKADAVETYNETFGETFGQVNSYIELERKLIEQGDEYIKYLGLKAQAEAAYQLAVEKSKEALLKRSSSETNFADYFRSLSGLATGIIIDPEINAKIRNAEAANDLEKQSDDFLDIQQNLNAEMERLANELGLVFTKPNKELEKEFKKLSSLLESLIKKQKALKTDLIENDRERDKTQLTDQLEDEKKAYKDRIDALKVSEEEKREIRAEYNRIFNTETGTAYEKLRRDILEIDQKYNEELEKVQFKALNAIDSVLGASEQVERQSIREKWDNIRDEIEKQIEQTNDQFQIEGLKDILIEVDTAENRELQDFDIETNLAQVDRQQDIADAVLKIYQTSADDVINNEKLKQLQLLTLEENYLQAVIQAYQDGIKSVDDKTLFDNLLETLTTSVDPQELQEAGEKLAKSFGEEAAAEILQTVGALKEVKNEINDIDNSSFADLIDDFQKWTSSLESFSKKLAETLGLQGKQAEEFASGLATAIQSTFESLSTIFELEIEQQRKKIDAIQESIDSVETELDRERDLYEKGFANNYDLRQKEIADLKEQKRQEEEELKKAQKKKAQLQKVEFVADTISQLGNLITASTNIFKWASKIPFIGVGLATGLIATMFGAFAVAKTKAFQAIGQGQTFRRGLKEGALSLDGPTHEESGFGLYNSKTGERVAEFEDGEKVYVANKQQQRKYRHILDAMINDSQGGVSLEHYLAQKYGAPKVGEQTMQVVRRVNVVTQKAEQSKEEASKNIQDTVNELKKLNQRFEDEFGGYKKDKENTEVSWETPEYFYVKKGNTTKKYPKKQ